MRNLLSAVVGGLFLSVSITSGQASPIPVGGAAPALAAWNEYCHSSPDDCRVDGSEPLTVPRTRRVMRLLQKINRAVNAAIIQQTDPIHRGVLDRWEIPSDGIGDCEDIQLLKRRLLVDAGLPRRVLLMTVVVTPAGEGHAVLTVRTASGDLILDNQNNQVKAWDATDLRFIKRESQDVAAPGGFSTWVALGVPPTAPVTAALP